MIEVTAAHRLGAMAWPPVRDALLILALMLGTGWLTDWLVASPSSPIPLLVATGATLLGATIVGIRARRRHWLRLLQVAGLYTLAALVWFLFDPEPGSSGQAVGVIDAASMVATAIGGVTLTALGLSTVVRKLRGQQPS